MPGHFVDIKRKKSETSKENGTLKNELVKRDHEINSLKHEIEELNHNLTDAFARIDEKENEIETIETDKLYLQQDIDEIRIELEEKSQELNRLQKQHEQKTADVERMSRENKNILGKYSNMEKQMKINEERNRELTKIKNEIQDTILALKKDLEQTNHELNRYKGETECLEGLKQNLEKERDRTISEYVECRNTSEIMRRERDKYTDENITLKNNLIEQQDAVNESRKEIRLLENKNAQLKRALLQYERDGEDIVDENARLKNENQLLTAKITRMQNETLAEVTEKYTESVKLRAELDAVKNELRRRNKLLSHQSSVSSESELSNIESTHRREVTLLKSQIEKLSEEEAKMKSELNMTKNKFSIYMKDRTRIENEMKEKHQQLEREKANSQTSEREKSLLQSRLDRLKASSSKRLESAGSEHKNKVNYLEHQIKAMKTTHALEIEAKKVEIDSLTRQLQLTRNTEHSRRYLDESYSTEHSRHYLGGESRQSSSLTNGGSGEWNNHRVETELEEMKANHSLRSDLYEKDIEIVNLKYNSLLADGEEEEENLQHNISEWEDTPENFEN